MADKLDSVPASVAAPEDAFELVIEEDEDVQKKAQTALPTKVIVHPLVLLSVVDHYHRVAENTNKRVCGVLLGTSHGTTVDISNSYAVPFEEDPKNPNTWYFDRNYHEAMFAMFKKVNASEKVLGWYSTGPRIRPADQDIHELMRKYVNNPVFVIVDVAVKDNADEIPTKAYLALRSTPEPNSKALFHFAHVPSEIGAEEAEEIGVEHLLREIKDARLSTITDVIGQRLASLRALETRMQEVYEYLDRVARGELPANPKIIYNIQNAFNLCPDVARPDLAEALTVKTNDSLMVLYIASLVRSITALHDLVKNKMMNRAAEQSERDKLALLAATQAIEEETGAAEIDADAVGDEF